MIEAMPVFLSDEKIRDISGGLYYQGLVAQMNGRVRPLAEMNAAKHDAC